MADVCRGLWYRAFFWVAIPMVLGWIDVAKLACRTRQVFRGG
jgi:hypothetical protein